MKIVKLYEAFITEKKKNKAKVIEMTGSPKSVCGYKTKEEFLAALKKYGFTHGKMSKRNNKVDILVCADENSNSNKMKLAKELGVEIMTYDELENVYL